MKRFINREGLLIMYIDENDFRKKARSLRKYNMPSYKYLCFHFLKNKEYEKEDGSYITQIPASKEFEFVYGKVKLHYTVHKGILLIEDLEPQQFLIAGYKSQLPTYRGMFYRDEKDKKKIDFIRGVTNAK